tara:strand:+ start:500 stop:727 length:228 start_codon:yes stop_codon:yes gene_type:complete
MIHEIVFHSNGGYDWYTVYNMPIWLRNFTFKKMEEHFNKQNKENDNLLQNQDLKNQIAKPAIQPKNAYNVGASKK